jgi:hypothetical protein
MTDLATVLARGEKYRYPAGMTWSELSTAFGGELWDWTSKRLLKDPNHKLLAGHIYRVRMTGEGLLLREYQTDIGIEFNGWEPLGTLTITASKPFWIPALPIDIKTLPAKKSGIYELSLSKGDLSKREEKVSVYVGISQDLRDRVRRIQKDNDEFVTKKASFLSNESKFSIYVRWSFTSSPSEEEERLLACYSYAWNRQPKARLPLWPKCESKQDVLKKQDSRKDVTKEQDSSALSRVQTAEKGRSHLCQISCQILVATVRK